MREETPMPLQEAVQHMETCRNFFRAFAQSYEAGLSLLQAQQGSEDLMRMRQRLQSDVARVQDNLAHVNAELEQAQRQSASEQTRLTTDHNEFVQSITKERADLSHEFETWKEQLERDRDDRHRAHIEAMRVLEQEANAVQARIDGLNQEFASLRQRLEQMTG